MAQTSITNYFSKRKRTGDEFNSKSKVLRLEHESSYNVDPQILRIQTNLFGSEKTDINILNSRQHTNNLATPLQQAKTVTEYSSEINTQPLLPESSNICGSPLQLSSDQFRKLKRKNKNAVKSDISTCDIREVFMKTNGNKLIVEESSENCLNKTEKESENSLQIKSSVTFELKGFLSPTKREKEDESNATDVESNIEDSVPIKNDTYNNRGNNSATDCSDDKKKTDEIIKEGFKTPKKESSKDVSLEELKKKVHRSAKMLELRKCLTGLNNSYDKLKVLEQRKKTLDKPKLNKFQAIEIEVPTSPQKSIYNSPQKVGSSPQSTPTKSPAYQKYASLAVPLTPTLPLPFNYGRLSETFRCVDTVSAMLHNRREVITLKKLKPAVQEMLRRNFVEQHLGQIKKVLPNSYDYHQHKCRNFGSTSKTEKYDLVLTPVARTVVLNDETSANGSSSMTPTCLLERRQDFHNNLLKITKDYHEEYLKSLDPPLSIPREQLTRWHPGFDLDRVPDIESEPLPQPPNVEKYTTAKDVLEKAKNLFSCNQRMEMALKAVSETYTKIQPPVTPTKTETSPVSKLLKGIPKGLLEKVRAKQAAKALQAMTRSPAQDREATQHVRLPEIARILRNLFVAEKKSVLPLDFVLEKLGHSYREKLSKVELEEHIRLLMKIQPDWLKLHHTRKTYFLRLSKERDMGGVMKQLEVLAAEKNTLRI